MKHSTFGGIIGTKVRRVPPIVEEEKLLKLKN